jgi:hypothetical protein
MADHSLIANAALLVIFVGIPGGYLIRNPVKRLLAEIAQKRAARKEAKAKDIYDELERAHQMKTGRKPFEFTPPLPPPTRVVGRQRVPGPDITDRHGRGTTRRGPR